MPITSIVVALSVLFLAIASYFDLKTGEIPDRVSLGFVAASLLVAGIGSLLNSSQELLVNSLLVGAGYFAFGYASFRLGQWGGGDVKVLSGIGCSIGYLGAAGFFGDGFIPYYLTYFVNLGLVGWPYVILYSLVLGVAKPESFSRFVSACRDIKAILLVVASFVPSVAAIFLGLEMLGLPYLVLPVFVVLSIYLKSVEGVALQKTVKVDELREFDALAEDLVVDGRAIARRRNIEGITKEQLYEIRKLASKSKIPDRIRIRWGIKFVPILFLAFVSMVGFGSLVEVVFGYLFSISPP